MNRIWVAAALVALVGGFATAVQANPIPIYNTGTAASGTGLAPVGGVDPHWVITSTPSSSATVAAYDVNGQPGTWGTNPNSQWITPSANGSNSQAAGNFSYQTTFDLTGLDSTTALLSGSVAADNCLTDIIINGTSTGIANAGAATGGCINTANFQSFLAFTINSGFVSGINTLTFLVTNGGATPSPTGLNVLVSGTADPLTVPEPGTLGMFGLALLGLGGLWMRRRACLIRE